ncbi:MAG: DUF1285 domain-containing protein [Alphaproteobacteria bacterium]
MTTDPADPQDLADRLAGARDRHDRREAKDCGHFDIRIARDGNWYYRGSPITRKPLVRLFSTVLIRDASGQYWLKTPVEKGRIDVDDAPFTAVELVVEGRGRGQRLSFRTNLDDVVTADERHPIRVATAVGTGEPSPYVLIRDGLEALISRPVFYELVDLGVDGRGEHGGLVGVWSSGRFFALGPGAER